MSDMQDILWLIFLCGLWVGGFAYGWIFALKVINVIRVRTRANTGLAITLLVPFLVAIALVRLWSDQGFRMNVAFYQVGVYMAMLGFLVPLIFEVLRAGMRPASTVRVISSIMLSIVMIWLGMVIVGIRFTT